jgi:hypothetical protein
MLLPCHTKFLLVRIWSTSRYIGGSQRSPASPLRKMNVLARQRSRGVVDPHVGSDRWPLRPCGACVTDLPLPVTMSWTMTLHHLLLDFGRISGASNEHFDMLGTSLKLSYSLAGGGHLAPTVRAALSVLTSAEAPVDLQESRRTRHLCQMW